jgi:copper chaperone CopZ
MDWTALTIGGMTCDHCVRAVNRVLLGLEGVEVEQVDIGSAAIEDEGYTVLGMDRSG